MRAAILVKAGGPFEVRDDVELIGPGAGEVRVKVAASGLCGSDLPMIASAKGPCVLGHEAAGVVIQTGEGVTNVAEGDHVILSFVNPCGSCPECISGHSNLCRTDFARMFQARAPRPPRLKAGGEVIEAQGMAAHAEESVVRAEAAIKIPEDVPLDQAALIGCGVTTGAGAALNTAKVVPGSSVAVFGCGGVGTNTIQGARIAGASVIVAVDTVEAKREDAKRFGATHSVHPDDLKVLAGALTDGAGFDYVFEVSNRSEGFQAALANTRRGGTIVLVGAGTSELTIPGGAAQLVVSEQTIMGSFYGSSDVRRDFTRLLGLWRQGKLDLAGLITSRIDLAEINEGYAAMRQGVGIRTVIAFS